jgi:hypothetical protein
MARSEGFTNRPYRFAQTISVHHITSLANKRRTIDCGGSGEIFSSHVAKEISTGNRNPQGDAIEAEEQVAAGRRQCPEAVTEQKAGYQTADAL